MKKNPSAGEAQATEKRSPRTLPVVVLTALLALLGIGLGFAGIAFEGWPRSLPWEMVGPFLVLLVAAGYFILRFQRRDQVWALDLIEAVLAPAIFIFPGLVAIGIAATGVAVSNKLTRNTLLKSSFNVAQYMFTVGAGSLVFQALDRGRHLTPRNIVAIVVGMLVVAALNGVTTATVISIAERQPISRITHMAAMATVLNCAINVPFGLLFLAAYHRTPALVALFVVPLLVLRWSHRSYAAVLADKARLSGMHRATRALAGPINPVDALPAFVEEVRRCFDASIADLVLLNEDPATMYRATATESPVSLEYPGHTSLVGALVQRGRTVRLRRQTPAPHLVGLLEAEGHRDCIAAPLFADGHVIGLLCAYDRSGPEGFEEGELAVLEALAREAAGALAKGAMLDEILDGRRKLTEIVEHTSDGIVTIAADGTIQLWNRGMEGITGYTAADVHGQRGLDRLRARDEHGVDVMADRWAQGDTIPSQLQIIRSDGETRWIACTASPVMDADDQPQSMILVVRDVTRAHEVERLKDDFVATVSHELRTPLTPIKGFAATLVESGDVLSAADRTVAARSILNQAEHLERLVVNLLEVSKLERGIDLDRHDAIVDVRAVAERVAIDFRTAHPDRMIILEVPNDCRARGDELFIGQILSNLVSNAIKYAPAEEPIEVRVEGSEESGVSVSVIDHGPGIPAAELERIFDRFHRLGNVMTRATGGTGLGLYIARQLAAAVGATLSVSSTVGEGSTFVLQLRRPARLVAVS